MLFVGTTYASTNNNTENTGESTNANTSEEKEKVNEPENEPEPVVKDLPEEPEADTLKKSQDSTTINSLSKFNFVFYFIYKLKYNEEPAGNEYQF